MTNELPAMVAIRHWLFDRLADEIREHEPALVAAWEGRTDAEVGEWGANGAPAGLIKHYSKWPRLITGALDIERGFRAVATSLEMLEQEDAGVRTLYLVEAGSVSVSALTDRIKTMIIRFGRDELIAAAPAVRLRTALEELQDSPLMATFRNLAAHGAYTAKSEGAWFNVPGERGMWHFIALEGEHADGVLAGLDGNVTASTVEAFARATQITLFTLSSVVAELAKVAGIKN